MDIINNDSLSLTLDALNEAFFYGKVLAPDEKQQAAFWLSARQGKPGSYAGMFAPTEQDLREGIYLFTGEKITSKAAAKHILGEETCRALLRLDVPNDDVKESLYRASIGMIGRLSPTTGIY